MNVIEARHEFREMLKPGAEVLCAIGVSIFPLPYCDREIDVVVVRSAKQGCPGTFSVNGPACWVAVDLRCCPHREQWASSA